MLLNALIKKGTLLNKSIQKHSEALRSIQRFDVFLMGLGLRQNVEVPRL
jgi:hypothetical protein